MIIDIEKKSKKKDFQLLNHLKMVLTSEKKFLQIFGRISRSLTCSTVYLSSNSQFQKLSFAQFSQ